MENKKLLVVFTSYYFGDKADKILTELEVPHQLMATPPELYDMCGLSVQIDPS
ncbi:MAG: putative Se/S carrier-like protein, partial [Veillonella sp.]|nr:putative Se/S carrier-like protein [Veillonella sp.]